MIFSGTEADKSLEVGKLVRDLFKMHIRHVGEQLQDGLALRQPIVLARSNAEVVKGVFQCWTLPASNGLSLRKASSIEQVRINSIGRGGPPS